MKLKIVFFSLIIAVLLSFNSCLVVKIHDDYVVQEIKLSPKPTIKMSEKLVRSTKGDMIAFLPEGWFFVDVEKDMSENIFAVAVNPDYTLTAVFSKTENNSKIDNIVETEGLLGLSRYFLNQKQSKTAGSVKQKGKFCSLNAGNLKFGNYQFTSSGGAASGNSAVFISSMNRYYEFTLMPMNLTGKSQPSKKEIQEIFDSILATIQF